MSTLRRNAVANLGGRLATAVLWIAATPFVLRQLGPERFGIWSLFFAFYAYLISFDLGTGHTMVRFIAAQRPADDRQALLRTLRWGLRLAGGLGLVWFLAIVLLRGWITRAFHVPAGMVPETLDALLIFGVGVLIMFPTQTLVASLNGFERIDLANLCQVLGVVIHVLVLVVGLSAGAGLRGAATAGALGNAVTGLLAVSLVWRELRRVSSGGGAGPTVRALLQFSAALQLLGVLIMLQTHSSRFALGLLGSLAMVADYELAFRVATTVVGLPIRIRDPVIPAVSRIWEGRDRAAVASLFASTSRWVYTNSVIALGLLWLLAPDVARLWLGPGHERIGDLMRVWVVAHAANMAYAPGVAIARGMGMPRFEILSYAMALVTNIGLAVWWVPRYGTEGAVLSVVVSYFVGFVSFVATFHWSVRFMPFWPWFRRDLVPRLVVGVAAVAVTGGLLAVGPLADSLPSPGWIHAGVTGVLFLAVFALFFLPFGDTQRLGHALWQAATSLRTRRGEGSPA